MSNSIVFVGTSGSGSAGQLTINAPKLKVFDGGGIVGSTVNSGNGGDLLINAFDMIEVSGVGSISRTPSRIGARAELFLPSLRRLFGLPDVITGNTGKFILNTPRLQITDQAIVGVDHQSVGNAGTMEINAGSIRLNTGGKITAATAEGEGGNIFIQANDLIMRGGSSIVTNAGGSGNGGNIIINSPILVGLENSDITANANKGNGGNIEISTQGIFGLQFRSQLTPENDITASSKFGVNGTVVINVVGIDPNSSLVELPANVIDSSQQITSGCQGNQSGRFVVTGRGGLPQNPNQQIISDRPWHDLRDVSVNRNHNFVTSPIPPSSPVLVQATGWHRNQEGKIELVADKSSHQVQTLFTCAFVPHK